MNKINYQKILDKILENIKIRDKNDMEKEIGALKKAEDAIYIDSTNMTIEEAAAKVVELAKAAR